LPPRGAENDKRKRQYEHIKESELKRGSPEQDAERIAAATTNKTKREKGETEGNFHLKTAVDQKIVGLC
jgi:hypothetical protein